MTRRFATTAAVVMALFAGRSAISAAGVSTAARPNVVVVLIDDMGWGDFSCFGNKEITTPNIDRLAAEGMRFEQFYVNAPICSPSRIALTTGQYPTRWQITSFLNNRAENERRGIAQWLDPKAPTLARTLHDAGYATGHFGKWHMGGQRDVGDAPLISEYGFDESLTNFEGLGPRVLPLLDAYDGDEAQKYPLGSDTLGHGPIHWEQRDKVTESYIAAAITFIDKAQANGRPFYLNLWPDDVHSPFFPPKSRRGDESKRIRYLGVLKTLDEQLRTLFARIQDDKGLRDNTVVLICSDNGPEDGAGSAGRFRGKKGMLYEGGIRSPLVLWAPGLTENGKAGTANTRSVMAAIDLVPSLLSICKVPTSGDVQYDGEAMSEVLLGKTDQSRSKPLFFRRPPDRPTHASEGNLPDLAVRDGHWKLLCEYDGSESQLYDLDIDPSEKSNVAERHPEIVRRLTEALLAWDKSMPADNGATYTAVGKPNNKNLRPRLFRN
jgi:arylsulfatase A-like enzyme